MAQNTGIERQTLVWKHISHISLWNIQSGRGGGGGWVAKSAETGTDHQWIVAGQSFRSLSRYALVCTAKENQRGTNRRGELDQIMTIIIINQLFISPYLGFIRHPDRQRRRRRRRGTSCHPIIIAHSGTMIRLITHLSGLVVHDLHTIIDNFSSAFPVGFDR